MHSDVRLTPSGEVVMSLAAFKAADYGQLCAALGLRPSKPNTSATKTPTPEARS